MRNRGLYICIEGLDGSGKSTIIEYLRHKLEKQGISISILAPTKMMEHHKNDFIEVLFRRSVYLNNNRFARALLYAHRSNQAAKTVNWNVDLILGDRSLLTSYVVRWSKLSLINNIIVMVVNLMEYTIIAPDHVIFLDVSYETLNERLNKRGGVRDIDENERRALQMKEAYFELINNCKVKRVSKVKWHMVCGEGDSETVGDNVLKIVNNTYRKTS